MDEGKAPALGSRVAALKNAGAALGLLQDSPQAFLTRKKERWLRQSGIAPQNIEELIRRRDEARKQKKWQEADRLRAELQEKGILIEDTSGGTIWKVK
jgi:cysteinyl-tRNA synthetase